MCYWHLTSKDGWRNTAVITFAIREDASSLDLESLFKAIMNLLLVPEPKNYFDMGFLIWDFLTSQEYLIFCFAFTEASLAPLPLIPSLSQNFLEHLLYE